MNAPVPVCPLHVGTPMAEMPRRRHKFTFGRNGKPGLQHGMIEIVPSGVEADAAIEHRWRCPVPGCPRVHVTYA